MAGLQMPLRMNGPCSSTSHSTHRALGKQQVLAFSRCSGPTVPRRSVVAYGGPDVITSGEDRVHVLLLLQLLLLHARTVSSRYQACS